MPAPIQQQTITPETFARVGHALFGPNWQTPLARALDVNERSVRRMLSGDRGIHAGIVADLVKILEDRGAEMHEVAKELRRALR